MQRIIQDAFFIPAMKYFLRPAYDARLGFMRGGFYLSAGVNY